MADRANESEISIDPAAELGAGESAAIRGRSPSYLAWRRLRRNYLAFAFLGLFILIVFVCAFAGLYAHYVAHTDPYQQRPLGVLHVNGKSIPIISPGGAVDTRNGKPCSPFTPAGDCQITSSTPVGPQWFNAGGRYVLGADSNGRDVAVRLLYAGRNSLLIGVGSAAICIFFAIVLALLAGYYRGWVDFVITRFFDLMYAFPVILLGIALGTALAIDGFHHEIPLGFYTIHIDIESGSILIPLLVISYVLVPYVGRPLRGQVLSIREKEFVEAAISQGASPLRIMFSEILPNIASSALVFFTLIIASNIVFEAVLSYLGAGVQLPTPSWGNLINEGQQLVSTRPWLALAPGIAITLTVLSLNVFGDGLRDALDPRAKVKVDR